MACYSYSYSDVVSGVTGNAASDGATWNLTDVLPPQAGLTVGGITYRYGVTKTPEDDFIVHNEIDNNIGDNIFRETDNWSGLPGNTIRKTLPLDNLPIDTLGDGRIRTEGTGTVDDPVVQYFYTYDECYDPLSSPECPGYANAFYQLLLDNNLLPENVTYDPLEDEFIVAALEQEIEVDEEATEQTDEEEEEENEEEDLQRMLSIEDANELVDDITQQQMLLALARNEQLNNYLEKELEGGTYNEVVQLQDSQIEDNRAGLRMGLDSQLRHNELVDLQYGDN